MHKRVGQIVNWARESSVGQYFKKYSRDRAPLYATVIAYNAILSLFPILLVILAVLGVFVTNQQAMQTVSEIVVRLLPADAEGDALRVLETSQIDWGLYGIIGFLGLLWSGSALFGVMADAFNRAFGVPNRGFAGQKLMSFGMILVFALLLLSAVLASSLAALLLSLSEEVVPVSFLKFELLGTISAWLTSLVFGFLLFLTIYWIVPNRSFRFGEVWPGVAVAAILFFLIAQVWPIYLSFFGAFSRFGALFGLFFLLMTWFFFLAHIVMLGVELNAFLIERHRASR